MNNNIKSKFGLLLLTLLISLNVSASCNAFINELKSSNPKLGLLSLDGKTLKVAVKDAPPFMMEKNGKWEGLSANLLNQLSECLDFEIQYKEYYTTDEMIEAVSKGENDLALSAISMNKEREVLVDFSSPYHTSNLAIMVNTRSNVGTFNQVLKQAMQSNILLLLPALFVFMLAVAIIYWRKEGQEGNEFFKEGPFLGIYNSIIWASLLIFRGKGDPFFVKSKFGQLFVLFLTFFGVTIISGLTALITSSLTLQSLDHNINSLDELKNKKIGTLKGNNANTWLNNQNFQSRELSSWAEVDVNLDEGKVDVFVHDKEIMQYLIKHRYLTDVKLMSIEFNPSFYSIAFENNSIYRQSINTAIMYLMEDGDFKLE